jgi:hypothetical protein
MVGTFVPIAHRATNRNASPIPKPEGQGFYEAAR